jgi:hypothetical protein
LEYNAWLGENADEYVADVTARRAREAQVVEVVEGVMIVG